MAREIEKKDRFFSVELEEGDYITFAVNGEVLFTADVGGEKSSFSGYVKSKNSPYLRYR